MEMESRLHVLALLIDKWVNSCSLEVLIIHVLICEFVSFIKVMFTIGDWRKGLFHEGVERFDVE